MTVIAFVVVAACFTVVRAVLTAGQPQGAMPVAHLGGEYRWRIPARAGRSKSMVGRSNSGHNRRFGLTHDLLHRRSRNSFSAR